MKTAMSITSAISPYSILKQKTLQFHRSQQTTSHSRPFTKPPTKPSDKLHTCYGHLATNVPVEEYRHPELDNVNYRREDFSTAHANEARHLYLGEISKGEALIDLATAALHIASEDDALVSHSSVKFPVQSYLQRLQRMADELASSRLQQNNAATPEEQLQIIMDYLFVEKGFTVPAFGRSNVPAESVVQNPGVWEDSRLAYLSHALVAKKVCMYLVQKSHIFSLLSVCLLYCLSHTTHQHKNTK